jgi:hypothetical protein
MSQYPRNLEERFAHEMGRKGRQIRRLQARMASIDSGWPLAALPGVIAATQTGPPATVTVYTNGATTASGPYQYLASYTPTVNDNVLLIPVGAQATYYVMGKVT